MKVDHMPGFICWLDRWALRLGSGIFVSGILANLILTETKVWAPFALLSILMGVFCYYTPRVLVRFLKWTTPISSRRRRIVLLSWLIPAGLFLLALGLGLALWPRSGVVNALAVLMPAALGSSVARLWREASSAVADCATPERVTG